jgi:hypothetical protein
MSVKETSFFTALLAGGCAGTSVDVALFPLDTIKTRLQVRREGERAREGGRERQQVCVCVSNVACTRRESGLSS